MYQSKKLLTLPVISLNDGEELGKVQGVIVDPEAIALVALILDYRRGIFKEPRIIPFEHIISFGDYAVTIKDSSACERAGQSPHLGPLFRRPTKILGAKVLTEDGNFLGTVDEFYFEKKTGRINGLELGDSFLNTLVRGKTLIEGDVITTIGKSAIIVKAGTKPSVKEESHLSETAKTVKETGQKVWLQTKETTKKLGESLYKSVERFTADEDELSRPSSNAPENKPADNPPGNDSMDPGKDDKAC